MYIDIVAVIGRDTKLRRVASTHGGELAGPCSLCHLGGSRTTGTDRLHVWPGEGRWACLGPRAGRNGCDLHGDAIDYLRHRDGIGYREACERLGVEPRQSAGVPRTAGVLACIPPGTPRPYASSPTHAPRPALAGPRPRHHRPLRHPPLPPRRRQGAELSARPRPHRRHPQPV